MSGRPTVVLAHEDQGFLGRADALLAAAGYEVVVAADTDAARAAIERHHPAVVVLDVVLSDGAALDLIPELRADPARADLKIVLVATTYDRHAWRRPPGRLYGADDWIEAHRIDDLLVDKVRALGTAAAAPRRDR